MFTSPTLRRDLFERVPRCILTSATLAVGSPPSFAFSASRLGLRGVKTQHLGSPFDHYRQMTVCPADGMSDPWSQLEAYERAAIAAIPHFVLKTHGKALVLFTSHRMMAEAAARLISEDRYAEEGSQEPGRDRLEIVRPPEHRHVLRQVHLVHPPERTQVLPQTRPGCCHAPPARRLRRRPAPIRSVRG